MRIIFVWAVAMLLMFPVSIAWYATLPVAYSISSSIESSISGSGLGALRIVEYVVMIWGPVWDLFIVLWAFMESHRVDITGRTYEG